MKTIEDEFVSQARWNAKGKSTLALIKDNPEKFFVNSSNFSSDKMDLIESMGNLENKTILEFGSGRGKLSVALAKLGANVTGIDIGENLIEVSKKIAELNNVEPKNPIWQKRTTRGAIFQK
jgi:2-polyprenyl-3-methyl-5-hydroxy-6-metoxy-1,4-benzoquinol methylase